MCCICERNKKYKVLVEKPQAKTPLWRLRRTREYNIKMNLKLCDDEDSSCDSGQGPVASCPEYGSESSVAIKDGKFLAS